MPNRPSSPPPIPNVPILIVTAGAPPPPVVVLADAIQDAALEVFRACPEIAPSDLVAAATWTLALFVSAMDDDDVEEAEATPSLVAALEGVRRSVAAIRRVDRARRRVQ